MPFDSHDAQTRNPQPYGTYRDTGARPTRTTGWRSPLWSDKRLPKITKRMDDGAYRRVTAGDFKPVTLSK